MRTPEIGSLAWEAWLEVDKLEQIIKHRMKQRTLGVDIQLSEDFDDEIANLETQLARHKKTFEDLSNDNKDGVGYIAALSEKQQRESLNLLKEQFGNSQTFTEEDIVKVLKWGDKTSGTIYTNLSRLRKSKSNELYHNKYQDLYSFSPEITPDNAAKKHFNDRYFSPSDLQEVLTNSKTGKSPTVRSMQKLVNNWLENENIGLYYDKRNELFTFDRSKLPPGDDGKKPVKDNTKSKKSSSKSNVPLQPDLNEQITLAPGWQFPARDLIAMVDRIGGDEIDLAKRYLANELSTSKLTKSETTEQSNDQIAIDSYPLGVPAVTLEQNKTYSVGETGATYRHLDEMGIDKKTGKEMLLWGKITGLKSERGLSYPEFARKLANEPVGELLIKILNNEKLPDYIPNQTKKVISELFGLWYAKEPSHPYDTNPEAKIINPTYKHKRDLIYSLMVTDLMTSRNGNKGLSITEALKLHPAAFGGAQKGAKLITAEIEDNTPLPTKDTLDRTKRDDRYRREKETIKKWVERYQYELLVQDKKPEIDNLEKFIHQKLSELLPSPDHKNQEIYE